MGVAEGPGITRGADCCAGARGSAEQPANVARLIASSTRVVNQQLAISPYVDSAYTEARAVHAKRGEAHEKTIYREVTCSRRAYLRHLSGVTGSANFNWSSTS